MVIVTYTLSCAHFKKYYTLAEMPLVIIASSMHLGGKFAHVMSKLALGDLFHYWFFFILLSVLRFIIRLPYPQILLNTHTPLRAAVMGLLDQLKNGNRVIPESLN